MFGGAIRRDPGGKGRFSPAEKSLMGSLASGKKNVNARDEGRETFW